MRKMTEKCKNLVYPERIRSTQLRKQIAITCQVLSMQEHELEWLANHMGENIKTFVVYFMQGCDICKDILLKFGC